MDSCRIGIRAFRADFNLNSIPSDAFFHGQWDSGGKEPGHPSIPYLIYRFLFMAIFSFCTVYSVLCRPDHFHVYFTNWTICLQTLYGIFYFSYIVGRKWSLLLKRLRGRGQVRVDAEQQPMADVVPVPAHGPLHAQFHTPDHATVHAPAPDPVPGADHKNPRKTKDAGLPGSSAFGAIFQAVTQGSNLNPTATARPSTPSATPSRSKSVNLGGGGKVGHVPSPAHVSAEMVTPSKDLHPSSHPDLDGGVFPVTAPSDHGTDTNAIDGSGGGRLPFPEKVIWIMMNITQTIPFIVSFVYWAILYKYYNFALICRKIRNWYITHSATALFALVDALMVAIPVRPTHFLFPASFISIFLFFSYIYEVAGAMYPLDSEGMEMKFIYNVLNWKEYPNYAVGFVVLAVFATCVFHTLLCWGIYKIKLKIASRLLRKRAENGP